MAGKLPGSTVVFRRQHPPERLGARDCFPTGPIPNVATSRKPASKGVTPMGFTKPYLPDVDPDTFLEKPLMERMRILATDWAENGFGSPRMIHTIYIVKLVVFFAIGGLTVATTTSGPAGFLD